MNTELLQAFNNAASPQPDYNHDASMYIRVLERNQFLRDMIKVYYNSSRQSAKGIKRLQNKIKRLQAELETYKSLEKALN